MKLSTFNIFAPTNVVQSIFRYLFCVVDPTFGSSKSPSTSSNFDEHKRHLQQTMHGAANSSNGDATNNKIPKLANIPITCARCQTTDARE